MDLLSAALNAGARNLVKGDLRAFTHYGIKYQGPPGVRYDGASRVERSGPGI